MVKQYFILLLLMSSFSLQAQKPTAMSEKIFRQKVIGTHWTCMNSANLGLDAIRLTEDSIALSNIDWIVDISSKTGTYRFLQAKYNVFELALFDNGQKVGYLYGYISGMDKLFVLVEKDRLKLSKGFSTFGEWKNYDRYKE